MNNLHYLTWEKGVEGKFDDFIKLTGFVCHSYDFNIPEYLAYYTDFDEEKEMKVHYVLIKEQSGFESVETELPWADEPVGALQPKYSKEIKEFWNEDEAFMFVYKVLAGLNEIPIFENAINLYKETPFVYSHANNLIAITYKPGKCLIYDSELEKITIYPSPISNNKKVINWYLQERTGTSVRS